MAGTLHAGCTGHVRTLRFDRDSFCRRSLCRVWLGHSVQRRRRLGALGRQLLCPRRTRLCQRLPASIQQDGIGDRLARSLWPRLRNGRRHRTAPRRTTRATRYTTTGAERRCHLVLERSQSRNLFAQPNVLLCELEDLLGHARATCGRSSSCSCHARDYSPTARLRLAQLGSRGSDRTRTCGLRVRGPALCPLSYRPLSSFAVLTAIRMLEPPG